LRRSIHLGRRRLHDSFWGKGRRFGRFFKFFGDNGWSWGFGFGFFGGKVHSRGGL
jgi:hypothetical protein